MHHTAVNGITVEIDPNEQLVLIATEEGVQWLKDHRDDRSDYDILLEILEPCSCNNSFTLFDASDANPNVGLTSAPCIAEAMSFSEDGQRAIEGRFWYFERYQLDSMVDTLINKGRISFNLGPSQEATPSPSPGP